MRTISLTALLVFAAAATGTAAAADQKTVQFFQTTCGICHGGNGEGIKGLAPPLKGNQFVKTADDKAMTETITKGRMGSTKKYQAEYPSPMPPQPVSADQLKALIAYLRTDLQK